MLKLENNEALKPVDFLDCYPLMSEGRPFVFLNACQAGLGTGLARATIENIVKTLLQFGSRSVIAPFVKIQTKAARQAADLFYDMSMSKTIPEAMQSVRQRAEFNETPDDQRATYLSYAAFTQPRLRLALK
jgi:hypothetical protein